MCIMPPTPTEEKLDAILQHIKNLDRRDRLRTWGGFFRSIITIIPVIVFLYASWYVTQHAGEIMQSIAAEAAQQTAAATSKYLPEGTSLDSLKTLMKK